MNTTRMKELLNEFKVKGICKDAKHKKPFADMLEWQDHIGRSNVGEIVSFWESLPTRSDDGIDQDTFLWANQSTLNPDTVNSIYRNTVHKDLEARLAKEAQEVIANGLKKVEQERQQCAGFLVKMNDWEAREKFLQDKITSLELQINREAEATENLVSRYERQVDATIKEKESFMRDHIQWTTLKSLVKDLLK